MCCRPSEGLGASSQLAEGYHLFYHLETSIDTVAIIGATGAQRGSVLTSLYSSRDKRRIRAITRNIDSCHVTELRARCPIVEWAAADNNGAKSPSKRSNGKCTKIYVPDNKQKIEQYVREHSDKIKGYFVYAAFYFQNFLHAGIWSTNSSGEKTAVFGYPLPADARQAYVDLEIDFGNTVRQILSDRDAHEGKAIKVVEGEYTGPEIAEAFTCATGIPSEYLYYKVPGLDRPEINEMLDFFVEFGPFNTPEFVNAQSISAGPFKTVDDFWQNHSAYRPEEY